MQKHVSSEREGVISVQDLRIGLVHIDVVCEYMVSVIRLWSFPFSTYAVRVGDERATRASPCYFVSVKSAANSFGSREKLSSGHHVNDLVYVLFYNGCSVATLVKAVVLSCV
jgi:hypothetical protein